MMIERIWEGLASGALFRSAFYVLLRIGAVLAGLAGLFFLIGIIIDLLRMPSLIRLVGGVIFLVLYLVALAALVLNLWKRAAVLASVPVDDYPVFDILAVVLRLVGETLAIGLGFLAFGGAIMMWLTGTWAFGQILFLMLPFFRTSAFGSPLPVFLSGLLTIILYSVLAVLVLLWNYFLAELVVLIKGIYRNTRLVA
jgi:hypothetical protein